MDILDEFEDILRRTLQLFALSEGLHPSHKGIGFILISKSHPDGWCRLKGRHEHQLFLVLPYDSLVKKVAWFPKKRCSKHPLYPV
jgi:hypothetical protein